MLKKINKGALLTVLVLALLITYIVIVEMQRNNEKGLIEEVCKKYIEFENKYTVIPIEYRNSNGKLISEDSVKNHEEEMYKELKEMMVDDENIYNQQKAIVQEKLDEQKVAYEVFTKKNSKSIKVKKYEFDSDQVVVTLQNVLESENMIVAEENENVTVEYNNSTNKSTDKYVDTITLKRENGKWKVVFADIETSLEEQGFIF